MKTRQQKNNDFTKNSTPRTFKYLSYGSQFSRFLFLFYVSKQVFYKWQDSRQLTVFVYLLFIIIIMEQLVEMYTQSLPLLPTIIRTLGTCSYYQHKNVFTIIYTCTLLRNVRRNGTAIHSFRRGHLVFLPHPTELLTSFQKSPNFHSF